MEERTLRRWRRLDEPGLELMRLVRSDDAIRVTSDLINAGEHPFALRYSWLLDGHWRSRSLHLAVAVDGGEHVCHIERAGPAAWSVDGQPRPDLNGCVELDVSATPFCNSLAIHHLQGRSGELTVSYILLPALSIVPSAQRYEAMGPGQWRFVDLGVAKGFTAVLDLDALGLVHHYEGLFETIR